MLPLQKRLNDRHLSLKIFRITSPALLFLLAYSVSAAQQPPPREGGGRGGPPPEAFTACETLAQGDVCTVEAPRGSLTGTCRADRRSDALICVPANRVRQDKALGDKALGDRPFGDGQKPLQADQNEGPQQRSMRVHSATQSNGLSQIYPANTPAIADNKFETQVEGEWRLIKANSISIHKTGIFPNPGNPNSISEQNFNIRIPASPVKTDTAKRVKVLGYALNGVSFDPGAGEFYRGDPSLGWQYEALSGAVALGIDANHAHVQPTGKYHYHGLPTGLMERLNVQADKQSPQIGWAVDGFPIYALYGVKDLDRDGEISKMKSSYRLKPGARPVGAGQPGGVYDGTFTADYEYVEGSGDLDACNGLVTITPDFPNGTYAYFLTENYPVVPRCVMGAMYDGNTGSTKARPSLQ